MKKWLVMSLVIAAVVLAGCQSQKAADNTAPATATDAPTATISVKNFGDIVVALDPTAAPNTVKNFMSLADEGFYNGLTFHRVISGFMIQGGDPNGDGTGDPGYSIKGEFSANGVENPIKHVKGVISMARAQDPDSAGSQFFIMHADADYLDGQYAAFGQVISGLDIVDQIAGVSTGLQDRPDEDVVIEKITIDAKGFDFSNVEKISAQ